jgi:hypothetical protein
MTRQFIGLGKDKTARRDLQNMLGMVDTSKAKPKPKLTCAERHERFVAMAYAR